MPKNRILLEQDLDQKTLPLSRRILQMHIKYKGSNSISYDFENRFFSQELHNPGFSGCMIVVENVPPEKRFLQEEELPDDLDGDEVIDLADVRSCNHQAGNRSYIYMRHMYSFKAI